MIKKSFLLSLVILWITGCNTGSNSDSFRFLELQTEQRVNPEGIDALKPRFSWKFQSDMQGVMQTAYQIEVAATEKELQDGTNLLWSTGKVESDQSLFVVYDGQPLESGKSYYWKLTVWTNTEGKCQSEIQHWSMALLNDSDWKAKWIGIDDPENLKIEENRTILPARYLRKEFEAISKPKRAVLYVSGVGSSVCYLNGQQIGNDVFGPLPTWYDASVPYLTYDVTSLLQQGINALGVALGNGRYLTMREHGMFGFGLPRLIAQLQVEYENGESVTIVSDETWQATNKGPITKNNEFDGEKYDARLELGAWSESGYDTST